MSKLATKLTEGFKALLPPTIFFFVALHLVALIRVLMLQGTGIAVSTPLQVTLVALILGKSVLIADWLSFINREAGSSRVRSPHHRHGESDVRAARGAHHHVRPGRHAG